MNLEIIQHPGLRVALKQGLNHILLKLTHIVHAVVIVLSTFDQLIPILKLNLIQFSINEAYE